MRNPPPELHSIRIDLVSSSYTARTHSSLLLTFHNNGLGPQDTIGKALTRLDLYRYPSGLCTALVGGRRWGDDNGHHHTHVRRVAMLRFALEWEIIAMLLRLCQAEPSCSEVLFRDKALLSRVFAEMRPRTEGCSARPRRPNNHLFPCQPGVKDWAFLHIHPCFLRIKTNFVQLSW